VINLTGAGTLSPAPARYYWAPAHYHWRRHVIKAIRPVPALAVNTEECCSSLAWGFGKHLTDLANFARNQWTQAPPRVHLFLAMSTQLRILLTTCRRISPCELHWPIFVSARMNRPSAALST